LSEQEHADLFVTLSAAFTVLLARYSRQEDIAFVDASQCRAFVLRTDLSGNPTVREMLRRVQDARLEACGRDLRSDVLPVRQQRDRKPTSSSACQIIFAMHNFAGQPSGAPKAILDRFGLNPEAVGLELGLFVWEEGETLRGTISYNEELFDRLTIERLSQHHQTLLESVGSDTDQRIGTLPVLPPAQRHQLLVQWNNTKKEYAQDQCVHQLFEAQARTTPDAIAVAFEEQQLSYRELNSRANRVGRCLRKLGVGPDALVGLCIERSPEMYVGILATLKAGGAYIPLDPNYPDERLDTIVSDARPGVLLTTRQLRCRLPEHNTPIIFLDEASASAVEEESNLRIAMTSDHLAYVIFTSGSTGKPKGVLISHRSLVNHSTAMARYYDLQPCDRVLQFASVSFDVAAEELFPTWSRGATVVPWPVTHGMPPIRSFFEFVDRQEVTVLNLPAPYWHEWVSELQEVGVPAKVRLVVVGSDKVSAEKFSIWKKQIGERVRLCNAYGPTEATITTTIYEPGGDFQGSQSDCVPIGRPIDNTEAYVLDQKLNLVPIGVPGELHIGGAGLARGYLNRPELTAERFIANPFRTDNDARIYKTGDVARYAADGNLEYLGRLDNQVKLRGFRIELGEIETVIRQHRAIQDAVVIVREDIPGDQRLVAYTIQARETTCTSAELRTYLQHKLPEYMVPAALVAVDSFPLTPSGKVDRRALPAPKMEAELCFASPRNDVERQLATLWEKLFALRPIGIHDDFFTLGGNSLLALRLTSRIEKQFGRNLPIAALYQAPTVEHLAKLITQGVPSNFSSLIPLQPKGSKPPFFWIHGENSNAFLPRYLGVDQPVYGFRHQSEDGQPARYTTVEEIAAHYLSAILTVQPRGPYFLGGYCFGGMVAFEIAQQLQKQAEQVPLIVFLAPDIPKKCESPSVPGKPSGSSAYETSFSARLHRYVRTLKALEPRQKVTYVVGGIKRRFKERIFNPAKKIAQKSACRFYFGIGYPLPVGLRSPYILDVYDQAVGGYVPNIHTGRVIVFKPTGDSVSPERWESFAVAGLEVYEVPGKHTDVVNKESHVALWARQLRTSLESAYSGVSKYDDRDPRFSATHHD
jgi:aspartate racemase